MRGSLLASLSLACGALLVSLGAEAIPIKVGLLGAAGSSSWTSPDIRGPGPTPSVRTSSFTPYASASYSLGNITLTGWEDDDGWESANMVQTPGVSALGIQCNDTTPNACVGGQIGSDPPQAIDIDISHLTGWDSLLITLDSVEGTNTGILFGTTCLRDDSECEMISLLGSCTATRGSCTINLSSELVGDFTHIWVMAGDIEEDPISLDGNLYVCAGPGPCRLPVPEPAALGTFGLGLLLIGVFLGLRRRRAS